MENEQVETMKAPQPPGRVMDPVGSGLHSDPKRELLSRIGLFIGMGLLCFWFGAA